MRYRELGRTGLRVSEIGFGGEWMDGTPEETRAVVDAAEAAGVNVLDCWMPDPTRRSNLGDALLGRRERWVIQGTSAPRGRASSTCARETSRRFARPSRIFSPASTPTTWPSA